MIRLNCKGHDQLAARFQGPIVVFYNGIFGIVKAGNAYRLTCQLDRDIFSIRSFDPITVFDFVCFYGNAISYRAVRCRIDPDSGKHIVHSILENGSLIGIGASLDLFCNFFEDIIQTGRITCGQIVISCPLRTCIRHGGCAGIVGGQQLHEAVGVVRIMVRVIVEVGSRACVCTGEYTYGVDVYSLGFQTARSGNRIVGRFVSI